MTNDALRASGTQYQVVFVNQSDIAGNACIYQQDPNLIMPDMFSLVWLAQAAKTTVVIFQWSIDYCFVWAHTGQLVPGIVFSASQVFPANLSTTNEVTFDKINGEYTFKNRAAGPTQGSLFIKETTNIPLNDAAVGIGMSGRGTFVVQAQPNINLDFTPQPEYWIAFGNYVQGEVIEPSQMSGQAQISFPPNVYSMTATFNPDYTWTIEPTTTTPGVE